MATKVNPNAPQPPPVQPNRVGPATQAPIGANTGSEGSAPAPRPASGFQQGTPGLQGKFAPTHAVRAGLFANPRAGGLNRTTDVLGPNKFTVGGLLDRIEEHLQNPAHPTDRDLLLLNGAINVLGQS